MAGGRSLNSDTTKLIRWFSLILSIAFVPGAIPAWLLMASHKALDNSKLPYTPLVMLATICILTGAAC